MARRSGGPALTHAVRAVVVASLSALVLAAPQVSPVSLVAALAAAADTPRGSSVRSVPVELGIGTGSGSGSPANPGAAADTGGARVVSERVSPVVDVGRARLVGLSWEPTQADVRAAVRVKSGPGWGPWTELDTDWATGEGAEDPMAGRQRVGTEPLWMGEVTAVQARVAGPDGRPPRGVRVELVDPGEDPGPVRSPAGTALAATGTGRPAMVTRAQWGADESLRQESCPSGPRYTDAPRVGFVHHTAGTNNYGPGDSKAIVRGIYAYSVKTLGWCDVGYNFMIDRFGTLFEARYGGVIGGATGGWNTGTFSVSVMGTFTSARPPKAATDTLARLLAWKLSLSGSHPLSTVSMTGGGATSRYQAGTTLTLDAISGHRRVVPTACPGDALYAYLPRVRQHAAALYAAAAPAGVAPAGYVGLQPYRLLDTRNGTGGASAPVGEAQYRWLKVAGRGGVPGSGVSAAVLNLTVTGPTAAGYVTAFPSGVRRPTASSLNFVPGQTRANLVTVPVGPDGGVVLFNSSGTAHLVADVMGYYQALPEEPAVPEEDVPEGDVPVDPTLEATSLYHPDQPWRLYDSRRVGELLRAGETRCLTIDREGYRGSVAATLNLTVTAPTRASYLTVWPHGSPRPLASNVNVVPRETVPNGVITAVDEAGGFCVFNSDGTAHVVVDVHGHYTASTTPGGLAYHPISPTRVLDTRNGTGAVSRGGALTRAGMTVQTTQPMGDEASEVQAIVGNLTGTQPSDATYVTAWPSQQQRPLASSLNLARAQTAPNMVQTRIGDDGRLALYNSNGATHVILDVSGWFG